VRPALLLPLALIALTACKQKSDAERAAEERAEARKRTSSSLVLVPYRSLKTVVRASGVKPPPPELEQLVRIYVEMKPLAEPENLALEAKQIAALALGLLKARALLAKADEDKFPTLWEVFQEQPPPLPWYSARMEHLGLALAAFAFEIAMNKDPVADVLFYEVDRGEPEPSWPAPLAAASRGARGLAYLSAGYHYAAEIELTDYLAELDKTESALSLLLAGSSTTTAALQVPSMLRAAGHLARAWNRYALKRDDPATDDLEAALAELDKLGVEDELVDWGWALVHSRRGRYKEAAQRLDKLAASPYLTEGERQEVKAYAESMEKNQGAILFGRTRAQVTLVRAVIARAGGLEKVLAYFLGPELAGEIYNPLRFLQRITEGVSGGVGGALEQVEGAGKRSLEALKEKVGGK
jgi:tetratricopeptide (TPR) repeat protein